MSLGWPQPAPANICHHSCQKLPVAHIEIIVVDAEVEVCEKKNVFHCMRLHKVVVGPAGLFRAVRAPEPEHVSAHIDDSVRTNDNLNNFPRKCLGEDHLLCIVVLNTPQNRDWDGGHERIHSIPKSQSHIR